MKVKEKIVISLLLLWQQLQKKGVEKIGTKNIIKLKEKLRVIQLTIKFFLLIRKKRWKSSLQIEHVGSSFTTTILLSCCNSPLPAFLISPGIKLMTVGLFLILCRRGCGTRISMTFGSVDQRKRRRKGTVRVVSSLCFLGR